MALYLQKYRSLCILCLFSLIILLAIYIFLRQSGDLEQSPVSYTHLTLPTTPYV